MRKNPRSARSKRQRPKTKLGPPDLDQAKAAVLGSLRSPESQRGYRQSIDEFIAWYCSEPRLSFNKTVVTRYRIHLKSRHLAPSTIDVRLAAVRRVPNLAPHDLRRSCARLCHTAGGEMEEIQFLLGHASVQTTESYLGRKQRLRDAVSDRIGIEP